MTRVKDKIRKQIDSILESRSDAQLENFSKTVGVWKKSTARPEFAESELKKIDQAIERAENSKDWISHQQVMTDLWTKIEGFSGSARQS